MSLAHRVCAPRARGPLSREMVSDLAAAVRIGVEHVVTYAERMADSARQLGLGVLALE